MNDLIEKISKNENVINNDYSLILIGFILCLLSSIILKYVYEHYSNVLSSKNTIGKIIPILSLSVFLIILVVKSSLALSLGLVGALSIVRFRTPIKEPEELVYLFLSISIGLGFGSGQIVLTSFVFVLIISIIILFTSRINITTQKEYNLLISWIPKDKKSNYLEIINEAIKSNTKSYNLIKYEYENESYESVSFLVLLDNYKSLERIINTIHSSYPSLNITYFENQEIM